METLQSSDSRQRLLQVALQLFSEKGLDGVSTRDLARHAGLNISLISYYFGGKEGLYRACLSDFAEKAQVQLSELLSAFDEDKLTKKNFTEFGRRFVIELVKFKMETPEITKMMLRESIDGLPLCREVYETMVNTMAERVIVYLMKAQKKGILRSDVNMHTLLFCLAHSVDTYILVSNCQTSLAQQCYRLPEQLDLFSDQIYKIYFEGNLL